MTDKKIKIFTISDHPFSSSGVGLQTKYIIEAMLRTGKFSFISFGGAIKHDDYRPVRTEEFKDDWTIIPVNSYGTPEMVRSVLQTEKPDILWFMTDPRFYGWLWEIENEVRAAVPMVYYHVWDNYPYPHFNKKWYDSNDVIATISKVTSDIVKNVSPGVKEMYIPHMTDTDIFCKNPMKNQSVENFRQLSFSLTPEQSKDTTIFFWNNRNARRKMSGTVVWWFKEFLDKVGDDKAKLVLHTDAKDPHGQDIVHLMEHLGLTNGQVMISGQKLPPQQLAMLYACADCTLNIADAEGFGLATFESLACETPVIVNMTGGLQEQVTDGENWFGIGIHPTSKAVIGSQEVPYIYEDRVSKEDFINALVKMHEMSPDERATLGKMGRDHILSKYSSKQFAERWDKLLTQVIDEFGSWDNRRGYQSWKFQEVSL